MPEASETPETIAEDTPLKNSAELCKIKPEKEVLSTCAVNGAQQDIQTEPHSITKNRRKIRQPKQYKPKTTEQKNKQNEDNNNEKEHKDTPVTTDHKVKGTHEKQTKPKDPPVSLRSTESPAETSSKGSPVHVMTASPEPKRVSPTPGKRSAPKPPKRPGGRGSSRRQKHMSPVVPMKPEDLIREAMAAGGSSAQATKRDAQYRKSYAYKIWKEKANCEVGSEADELTNYGPGGNGPVSSRRGPLYWRPNPQYNGVGFCTNGEYYEVNPPQVIHGVNSGPQGHQSTPITPIVSQPLPVAPTGSQPLVTNLNQSAVGPSLPAGVPPSQPMEYYREGNPIKDITMAPPNGMVVPQSPPTSHASPPNRKTPPDVIVTRPSTSPQIISSPDDNIAQKVRIEKVEESAQSPEQNDKTRSPPSKSKPEKQLNSVTTSPTSLVTVMKSTLRKKHCKENVQPLSVALKTKQKTKRKLEKDKNDSSPARKSAKPTIFTPLDEEQAEKLANDIYDVNLEYFPFQTLAEKAAQNGEYKAPETETTQANKAEEIEKVRCLLKDFYDVTHSCTEDPDMQKFDSASRKFGRKNILNHLSLLDRYLAELHKRVDSTG